MTVRMVIAIIDVLLSAWFLAGQAYGQWKWSPPAEHHEAVCHIVAETKTDYFHGSGTLIEHNGMIGVVTAAHNADEAPMTATFPSGHSVMGVTQYTDRDGHDLAFMPTGPIDGIEPIQLAVQTPTRRVEAVSRKSNGQERRWWAGGFYHHGPSSISTRQSAVIHGDSGGGLFAGNKLAGVIFANYSSHSRPVGRTRSGAPVLGGMTAHSVEQIRPFLDRVSQRDDLPRGEDLIVYTSPGCLPCGQFRMDFALNMRGLRKYLRGRFRSIRKRPANGRPAPTFVAGNCQIQGYEGAQWLAGRLQRCSRPRRESMDGPTIVEPPPSAADIDYDRIADLIVRRMEGNPAFKGEPGRDGLNGKDGVGIDSAEIVDGQLTLTYTDGREQHLGRVVGRDGLHGEDGADGKDGEDGTIVVVIEQDGEELHRTEPLSGDKRVRIPIERFIREPDDG